MTFAPTTSPRRRNAFRIPHSPFRISSPAFTIIEIIVVVTIIIVLAAILIPAVSAGHRAGNKAANTAQLSSIQSGLQQYYSDFNLYPPSNTSTVPVYTTLAAGRGPALLAEALMGYLNSPTAGANDGAGPAVNPNDPALGFRTRAGAMGKIYGPYASDNPKGFKVNLPTSAGSPTDAAFIDIFGHEILYFASTHRGTPSSTVATPTQLFGTAAVAPNSLDSSTCYFNDTDNQNYYPATSTPPPTLSPLVYADGSTTVPLPSSTAVSEPITATNKGPTKIFFQNLAGRSSNLLSSGSGPVMGADSFLLISIGEDNNPYTDDDILATNR